MSHWDQYMSYEDIESLVFQYEGQLKKASLKELYEFAQEEDIDSALEYSCYKKALLEIGVDYDAMKEDQ